MNISSLQDFDAKVPKDDELKHLDVRRFRSNIIGKCDLTQYEMDPPPPSRLFRDSIVGRISRLKSFTDEIL